MPHGGTTPAIVAGCSRPGPRKSPPRADALFAHVPAAQAESAAAPDTLGVSLDTEAEVKVGDSSRGGAARGAGPVKARDRDLAPAAVPVPLGVLESNAGRRRSSSRGSCSATPATWGVPERHGGGALLSSVGDVLRWAGSMTWRGVRPPVGELVGTYERGVRRAAAAFRPIAARLVRSGTLPKWSVTSRPEVPGD